MFHSNHRQEECSMRTLINLGIDGFMVAERYDVLHVRALRLPVSHWILPEAKGAVVLDRFKFPRQQSRTQ